jgi:hypothetical protein
MSMREPSELLPDELQRVLARYRDGTAPTEQVRARLWLRLAGPGVGTAAATSTILRLIVGGAIAGAIAAIGIVGSQNRDSAPVSRRSTVEREAPSDVIVAELPASIALPPSTTASVIAPAPVVRAMPSHAGPRSSAPKVVAERGPSLAEEIALLERARIALGQGDAASTWKILAEHERRFADGALVEERTALRIVALCSGADAARGADEARTFLASHPTAALAARIRKACE